MDGGYRPATRHARLYVAAHKPCGEILGSPHRRSADPRFDRCRRLRPDAIADPRIARLRRSVRLEPFGSVPAPPYHRPASVRVKLADGTVVERTCMSAIGSPDRPLGLDTLLDEKLAAAVGAAHPRFVLGIRRLLEQPDRLQRTWNATLYDLLEE